jgi:hypothetical protein
MIWADEVPDEHHGVPDKEAADHQIERATTQSTCWRSCTNNRLFSEPKSNKKRQSFT